MEDITLLEGKVRKATEEDLKRLPFFSYSKLETFWNCPHHYYLKYINKNFQENPAIHFDVGNLCHGLLEEKARKLMAKEELDYAEFNKMFYEGYKQNSEKGEEFIKGTKEIAHTWGKAYGLQKDKFNLTYNEKMTSFINEVFPKRLIEKEWEVLDAERPFTYVYSYAPGKEVILHGFIDSVRHNKQGGIKVVDYKTGKPFDEKKTVTSPQMCIYGMAIYLEFEQLPVEYEYDFVLYDKKMKANTTGYLKRFLKKMDKALNDIDSLKEETANLTPEQQKDYYKPMQCPLCNWCETRSDRKPQEEQEREPQLPAIQWCDYWSKWTPEEPSRNVNMQWKDPRKKEETKEQDIWEAAPSKRIRPSRNFSW